MNEGLETWDWNGWFDQVVSKSMIPDAVRLLDELTAADESLVRLQRNEFVTWSPQAIIAYGHALGHIRELKSQILADQNGEEKK